MKLPTGIPQVKFSLPRSLGRRSGGPDVVGLDIQPGFIAAVQARVNGSIVAERAVTVDLPADTVRDGEVVDEGTLTEALRELFRDSGLGKRVRIGVANQRTVLRTLELPPVTDQKELAAAVMFQAQDQVPMPLNNAVLDFHPLGIVDTPAGPRQRVVLVAAQRDMIERLLAAVRNAGLTPEGVDLSAFALIRSLYSGDTGDESRVLYLNVDGLTNLAIAEGTACRFTRVVGSGLEGMAVELAERRGIALADARAMLAAVDLRQGAPAAEAEPVAFEPVPEQADAPVSETEAAEPGAGCACAAGAAPADEGARADHDESFEVPDEVVGGSEQEAAPDFDYAYETGQGFEEPAVEPSGYDLDVWNVLESGIRDIAGEVRNSLDFHRSQDGGGEVSYVVLSGAAEEIPGFAENLQLALGVEVRPQTVGAVDGRLGRGVSAHRLAVATGLATFEVPQ